MVELSPQKVSPIQDLPQDSIDADGIFEQERPTTFINNINFYVEIADDELVFVSKDAAKYNPNFCLPLQNFIFYTLHDDSRISCKFGRREEGHLWKLLSFKVTFYPNCDKMRHWVQVFNSILKQKQKPRRLMFIINPVAGNGSAQSHFIKNVSPVLEDLEIGLQSFYTTRKGEAQEVCESLKETKKYEGIVVLGGDGTVNEAVRGLLSFDDTFKLVSPQITIGVIPCGTSNALAYTIHGTDDRETALIHILMGNRLESDVLSMIEPSGHFLGFAVTLISFGFIAGAIHASKSCKLKGPNKYKASFLKALLKMKKYNCSLKTWQLVEEEPENGQKILCRHDCCICSAAEPDQCKFEIVELQDPNAFSVDVFNHPGRTASCPYGGAPYAHICDGLLDIRLVGNVSRNEACKFLDHFTSCPKGPGVPLDFVTFMRAKKVLFKYAGPNREKGCFIIDGEVLLANEVGITSHHRAFSLFGSGEQLPLDANILKYSSALADGEKSKCTIL